MIRCMITDGTAGIDEAGWLRKLSRWMERGVELVQVREQLLNTRELAALTRKALALPNPLGTNILVNDRADVAIACGADGVHLRDEAPRVPRSPQLSIVTASAHRIEQIPHMKGVDFILLAPIFKPLSKESTAAPLGLDGLRQACALTSISILALGGITEWNAFDCVAAGAAGIAGISYFA